MATNHGDAQGLFMIKTLLVGKNFDVEKALIDKNEGIKAVYTDLASMDAILQQVKTNQPHIIIIDEQNSSETADELCLLINLSYPQSKVMIISDKVPDVYRLRASGFKCRGYITNVQRDKIVKAIQVVHAGEAWLPRKLVADLLDYVAKDASSILPLLRLVK
jgi:DNA-binding NarL/FixJ family response regulator